MKKKLITLIGLTLLAAAGLLYAQTSFTVTGTISAEDVEAIKQLYREAGGTNTGLTLKNWALSNNLVEVKIVPEAKMTRDQRIQQIWQKLREADDDKLTAVETLLGMR